MWNSKYGELNKDLMHDITLILMSEKVKKVKKYPNRQYMILEENTVVVRETIIDIIKSAFSNKQVVDNDSNFIDDYELDKIVTDIIFILYTSNNIYKEAFLGSYIAHIKNNKLYIDKIVNSILSLGDSVVFPMVKDLFNFEDIFIEDVIFDRDNKDYITMVAIKFLN